MYVYERAILKTYPHFEKMIESLEKSVYKRAVNSAGDLRPTSLIADELLVKINKKSMLVELKYAVEETLKILNPRDSYMLKAQYGVGNNGVGEKDRKDRNFYRMVAVAVKRFAEGMQKFGFDKEVYDCYLKAFPIINGEYQRSISYVARINESSSYKVKGKTVEGLKSLKPRQ